MKYLSFFKDFKDFVSFQISLEKWCFCPAQTKLALGLTCQKGYVCTSGVCLCSVSVSNFLGFYLANALVSGIPFIQGIEPSNSRDQLSHATFKFFSLAEPCHTQIF